MKVKTYRVSHYLDCPARFVGSNGIPTSEQDQCICDAKDKEYQQSQIPAQGWQCPVCGKVMAPWVDSCPNPHIKVNTHPFGTGRPFQFITSGSNDPKIEPVQTTDEKCYSCGGVGKVAVENWSNEGYEVIKVQCETCNGTGNKIGPHIVFKDFYKDLEKKPDDTCRNCGGKGNVTWTAGPDRIGTRIDRCPNCKGTGKMKPFKVVLEECQKMWQEEEMEQKDKK